VLCASLGRSAPAAGSEKTIGLLNDETVILHLRKFLPGGSSTVDQPHGTRCQARGMGQHSVNEIKKCHFPFFGM
jgi:hypothetical protein